MGVPQGQSHLITETAVKERREYGSQKSGQHVAQELHHRHHLLSEGCPNNNLAFFRCFLNAWEKG